MKKELKGLLIDHVETKEIKYRHDHMTKLSGAFIVVGSLMFAVYMLYRNATTVRYRFSSYMIILMFIWFAIGIFYLNIDKYTYIKYHELALKKRYVFTIYSRWITYESVKSVRYSNKMYIMTMDDQTTRRVNMTVVSEEDSSKLLAVLEAKLGDKWIGN
jgi:hypothetical protein